MGDAKESQSRWSFAILLSPGALRKSKEKREEAAGEMSKSFWKSCKAEDRKKVRKRGQDHRKGKVELRNIKSRSSRPHNDCAKLPKRQTGEGPDGVLVKDSFGGKAKLEVARQKTALQEAAERGGKKGAKAAGGTGIKRSAREGGIPRKALRKALFVWRGRRRGQHVQLGGPVRGSPRGGAAPAISGNLLPAGPALQKGRIVTPSAAADWRCPAIPSHPGSAPLARPGAWK